MAPSNLFKGNPVGVLLACRTFFDQGAKTVREMATCYRYISQKAATRGKEAENPSTPYLGQRDGLAEAPHP